MSGEAKPHPSPKLSIFPRGDGSSLNTNFSYGVLKEGKDDDHDGGKMKQTSVSCENHQIGNGGYLLSNIPNSLNVFSKQAYF